MGQPLFLRKSYPLWQKRLRSACTCAKLLSKEKKGAGLAAEELPMKIYTLTLSPAYDVHAVSGKITACHENLATVQSREAGGKGVNISRALHNYGVENKAVVLLGSQNSGDFKQALRECGLDCILFEQEGRIRENLTIHCPGDPETRISFTGFQAEAQILEKIHAAMDVDNETVVTFTGRVPEGIAMEKVKSFLKELKARGIVRHIGFSSHTPVVANRILDTGLVDMMMFSINPAYDFEKGDEYGIGSVKERFALFHRCAKEGVGISGMKPFFAGQLLSADQSPFGVAL